MAVHEGTPGDQAPSITIIAAVATNGVIGNGLEIPWHLPADFAHFKGTTMGGTLIMGRTTFDAIGRPLPGRLTIVLTRDPDWSFEGVLVAHTLADALELAAGFEGPIFIAGGAQIYAVALPLATHLVLTRVDAEPVGDVLFPTYDLSAWRETACETHPATEGRPGFAICWYERLAGPGDRQDIASYVLQ